MGLVSNGSLQAALHRAALLVALRPFCLTGLGPAALARLQPGTPEAPGKGRLSQRPRTFGPAASVISQRLLRPTAVPRHLHLIHVSAASQRPVGITSSTLRVGRRQQAGQRRGPHGVHLLPQPRASSSASAEDVPLFRPATGSTGQPRPQHPGLLATATRSGRSRPASTPSGSLQPGPPGLALFLPKQHLCRLCPGLPSCITLGPS